MRPAGDGLERLLSAVFEGDEPTPELLATYAQHPESLSVEARREIERALAARPDLADEVRLLKSFRVPSLAEPAVRRAPGRRWQRFSLWASAAAAAVLVVSLTPSARRWLGPLEETSTPAPSVVPVPAEPQASAPPSAYETPVTRVEPPEVVASTPPSPPAPEQRAEAPAPVAPAEPAPREELSETQVAVQEPVQPPSEPSAPEVPAPGPFAMSEPSYRRPAEALDRRRIVVAMRGPASDAVDLAALAPEHVALTGSAAPVLFWRISRRPPEGAKVLLRILEERSGDPLVETELPVPGEAGLQRLRVADVGATLAPGVVYTWYVVVRVDPENPARDQVAQGWIQRRELDVAPTGDPGALPAELAGAGLWYDALSAALDLRAQQPDDEAVQRGIRALLAQAGVAVEL